MAILILENGQNWSTAVRGGASPRFSVGIFQTDGDRVFWANHNGVPLVAVSLTDRPVTAKMYGMDYDFTSPPEPEKSPVDKAIEEMMAKRKAKREKADALREAGAQIPYEQTTREIERAKSLDRAMQKLIPAETDFRSRLTNVKVPE